MAYFIWPFFPQSSEGREYLLSLEHVAAWVAERVLPFLAERPNDGDDEDMEKSQLLAARIIEVSSVTKH